MSGLEPVAAMDAAEATLSDLRATTSAPGAPDCATCVLTVTNDVASVQLKVPWSVSMPQLWPSVMLTSAMPDTDTAPAPIVTKFDGVNDEGPPSASAGAVARRVRRAAGAPARRATGAPARRAARAPAGAIRRRVRACGGRTGELLRTLARARKEGRPRSRTLLPTSKTSSTSMPLLPVLPSSDLGRWCQHFHVTAPPWKGTGSYPCTTRPRSRATTRSATARSSGV